MIQRKLLLLLLSVMLVGGCASSKPRNGKLKQGKPIPCPMKDC